MPPRILQGDFDSDGLDDFAYYSGGVWNFVRASGAAGSSFGFAAASSDLGDFTAGNTASILVGDWDGDGRDDLLGWDGSAWQLRISQGTSSESNFLSASHNLGTLGNGDTSLLVSGDWDGDGADDLAAAQFRQRQLGAVAGGKPVCGQPQLQPNL